MKPLKDVLWAEHTRAELVELARLPTVVVVPIASTEQHGVALPVNTDQQTVNYVAPEGARRADDVSVLVTPTISYGVSPHHMQYGGTLSLRIETAIAVLTDVCQSIVADGFDRILILSGHGGNGDTVRATALQLRHTLGRQIEACCWWDLCAAEIDAIREGPCPTIGHAGESEASTILFLRPDLVRRGEMRWVEGTSDDPSLGTADKGERILEAGAEALAKKVRQMAAAPATRPVTIKRVNQPK